MTPLQQYVLTHLGIERWVMRTSSFIHPLCVVHDLPVLEGKAANLLRHLLQSIQLTTEQVQVLSREEYTKKHPAGSAMVTFVLGAPLVFTGPGLCSFSLMHLLSHPADKKQAYVHLLAVKQLLPA